MKFLRMIGITTLVLLAGCGGGGMPPTPVVVTVSPSLAIVDQGATQQFTATVSGTSNTGVTWSVRDCTSGGSITAAGLYTAPAKAGFCYVVATSQADGTKSALVEVRVNAVAVSVSPNILGIDQGATKQFSAGVTGTINTGVTWSVQEGAAGGSITATGMYTAPAKADTFHVVATSQANGTTSAQAEVNVKAVAVSVSPEEVSGLDQGASLQFSVTVTGSVNTGVTWSVQEGAAGGSITATGLYTSPAKAGSFHVVATSQADSTERAAAEVTVNDISVSVSPQLVGVQKGRTQGFSASVWGTTNKSVTWSVQEGAVGGNVTPDGVYSAPGTLGTYHVIATSIADPTKAATATTVVVDKGFTLSGEMSVPRQFHTATLLLNGEVLVTGGVSEVCDPDCRQVTLSSAELFNPITNQFRPTGAMSGPRVSHTATLLSDGKVLVAGGGDWGSGGARSTAELYDPATGTFSPTGSLNDPRSAHTATRLSDGKVFVAGGWTTSGNGLFTTEVYDPASKTFTPARGMTDRRGWHTATLLVNGKVLLAGGIVDGHACTPLASAEMFDPSSGTFASTGSLAEARDSHTATLLNNGRVLVAGGEYDVCGDWTIYDDAEIFDPVTGAFGTALKMPTRRVGHTATLLPDGKVLLVGGAGTSLAELFDPSDSTFNATGGLSRERYGHTATLLKDGRVLIVGGSNEKTAEVYQ